MTRKKAVPVALTLTHLLMERESKLSTSPWGEGRGVPRNMCSTFIEDYRSLCFAAVQHSSARSEEQSNVEGKEVGSKQGSEKDGWRHTLSCVWILQICCSTSYWFSVHIYHWLYNNNGY